MPNRIHRKSQSKNRSLNLNLRISKIRNRRARLKIMRKNWRSFQRTYFTCKTKLGKSLSGSSSIWEPKSRDSRDSSSTVTLNKNSSNLPKGKKKSASLSFRRKRDPEHILTPLTSLRSKGQSLLSNGPKFYSVHAEITCLTLDQRELPAAKAPISRCHLIVLKGMVISTNLGAGLTAVSLAPLTLSRHSKDSSSATGSPPEASEKHFSISISNFAEFPVTATSHMTTSSSFFTSTKFLRRKRQAA